MVARRIQPDDEWREQALCNGMDRELFFPHIPYQGSMPRATREQVRKVIAVCLQCPVRRECRAYANYFGITDGIWGGVLFNRRGRPSRQNPKEAM